MEGMGSCPRQSSAKCARRRNCTGERYYEHWLAALERIALRKDLVDDSLLRKRRAQWEDAARHTPHGQPIVLPRD